MTPEEWQRELSKNAAKKDAGSKRKNPPADPRRDDNQRGDHHDR